MLPVYDPGPSFETTLASVLDQDPGADVMQIEVVDGGGERRDWEPTVRRLAGDRVSIHRSGTAPGLAPTWNVCLMRARGRWVHLLHQDDVVLPGFYARLGKRLQAAPDVGAAFCRFAIIDRDGHWLRLSALERRTPGTLERYSETLALGQRIQCPAMVVRRDVYEMLGGFRSDLRFALDWEMWVRVASRFPIWFEPQILACYREHPGSESSRQRRTGADTADMRRAIELLRGQLPPERADTIVRSARRNHARYTLREVVPQLIAARDLRAAWAQSREAVLLDPSWRVLRPLFFAARLALRAMRSARTADTSIPAPGRE